MAIGTGMGLLIAGLVGGAGQVYGAKKQSGAVKDSARRQTEAATEAARIEDEAAKRAEAFQRQQAQQQWAEAEHVRKSNYDQWASRQRALNAFRAKHGYGATEIPGYAASQDPGYNTGAPPAGGPPRAVPRPADAGAPGERIRLPNRPVPMGGVDAYLPSQGPAFQRYDDDLQPYAPMSVDGYLRHRR